VLPRPSAKHPWLTKRGDAGKLLMQQPNPGAKRDDRLQQQR
jgi:hypothetical protein